MVFPFIISLISVSISPLFYILDLFFSNIAATLILETSKTIISLDLNLLGRAYLFVRAQSDFRKSFILWLGE